MAPYDLTVTRIAQFDSEAGSGGAEIVAHEAGRFYVSNGAASAIDVFEEGVGLVGQIDLGAIVGFGGVSSVAVKNGVVAVAAEGPATTDRGFVAIYDAETLALQTTVPVGPLPDMLTFTADGSQILVANEGEPDDGVDPVGGVSVITLPETGPFAFTTVVTVSFDASLTAEALQEAGVRIDPAAASPAADLEPEFIAIAPDGETAYVTLQENNAVAVFDIDALTFTDIRGLGTVDHDAPGFALDASDRDDAIRIVNWKVEGMRMPDAIAAFEVGGQTYYATANEGDARDSDERIKDIALDETAFPLAEVLQRDENLGRLQVSSRDGDTDGDGDFDTLFSYGSRSFTIFNTAGDVVFDSGDDFERIIAADFPDRFNTDEATQADPTGDENRSDNKGPEPEAIAIAEVEGRTLAVIGLERDSGLMIYDVSEPADAKFLTYVDGVANGDLRPEGIAVIAAEDSPTGRTQIAVSYEESGTTSLFDLTFEEPAEPFRLQLLHMADQEASSQAVFDAPRASAVLAALEAQDVGADATLKLSSGDAILPGLFFQASEEVFGQAGVADMIIQNELGWDAIAFGNHEFDFGPGFIADLIDGTFDLDDDPATAEMALSYAFDGVPAFSGTAFPYLSANLDFGPEPDLASLEVSGGGVPMPRTVTSSVAVEQGGELIGVVGATTPTIDVIATPGMLGILPEDFDGDPTPAQLDALAAVIQGEVDALLAANPGMNKVILLAHMQQIAIEQALAERLIDVDIIVAGGSNTRLFDETDRPREGDDVQGEYPIVIDNAGGTKTLLVNTDGSYKYVGRLVIDFDADGNIIADSYDADVSGAYATDEQGVADLGAQDLIDPEIQAVADLIGAEIARTESNVFGVSDVYLAGLRPEIRQQETNLGNLTADANLAEARKADPTVLVSIKNGGGIRDDIGRVIVPAGGTEPVRLPNEEILDADGAVIKPAGGISQNDIGNTLRFNNDLTLLTLTGAELRAVLEHGVAASTYDETGATNQQGRFPQIAGMRFSFDPDLEAGARIVNAAILNEDGSVAVELVRDGQTLAGEQEIRIVTLGFLAGGGDGYPFPQGPEADRVDLLEEGAQTGAATFADDGSEQDALAEYLAANFLAAPFDEADTAIDEDLRIQNLNFRADAVFQDTAADFKLQLFHLSDQEANTTSVQFAPNLSAVHAKLSSEDLDGDGVEGFADTLFLSSGDAWIPGLFYDASEAIWGVKGAADILIQNELGVQAISFGNHEFDQGTAIIAQLLEGLPASAEFAPFNGANFPYLAGNLDLSGDANLAPLAVADGLDAANTAGRIAGSTVVQTESGERIGVVSAVTPTLREISSPGDGVGVLPYDVSGSLTEEDLDALAVEIQADVDALLASNPDIDKVILSAHMQVLEVELALAERLSGVDIIIAGGSNRRLFDENDEGFQGETAQGVYPLFRTGADGAPVAIVNTDKAYEYLGRLVIEFDENGVIIPDSYDPEVSGVFATDAAGLARIGAEGLVDPEIAAIAEQVAEQIAEGESSFFGVTDVFLNGERQGGGTDGVRTQETNLGNLTADANLWYANQLEDGGVLVSIKNGGGIRASIGSIVVPGGGGEPERLPPEPVFDINGDLVKPEGGISQNDIGNTLAFNNGISVLSLTTEELAATLEHIVSEYESLEVDSGMGQVGGVKFSFDPLAEAGQRVVNAGVFDGDTLVAKIVEDGDVVDNGDQTFRTVTINFLANGGSGYPFDTLSDPNRIDYFVDANGDGIVDPIDPILNPASGGAVFAQDGSEQDALAEYLLSEFGVDPDAPGFRAFDDVDTPPELDERIQNLDFRVDAVFGSDVGGFVINEFSVSTTSTDVEYVEFFGAPNAVLEGLTLLEIEGDGAGAGVIDGVFALDGLTTDDTGIALLNLPSNAVENGSVSLLLVEDFTGALGDDLDSDDDGVFDATPWSAVIDDVAVLDGDENDRAYASTVLDEGFDDDVLENGFAPGGASRIPGGVDTDSPADWVRNDFNLAGIEDGSPVVGEALNTPGAPNAVVEDTGGGGDPELTLISAIQSAGAATPLAGQRVTVQAVVTVVSDQLNGFFLQEEDADADSDASSSEGVFVFTGSDPTVSVGQLVEFAGTAGEFFGATQLSGVGAIAVLDEGVTLPEAVTVTLPLPDATDPEAFYESLEGMRVRFVPETGEAFTVSGGGDFGETAVTVGDPLIQSTQLFESFSDEEIALREANARNVMLFEDAEGDGFSTPARSGDGIVGDVIEGALHFSFGNFKVETQGPIVEFTPGGAPRPETPPEVGGDLTVASFNVLNYFTTFGGRARGADNEAELADQTAKLVAALQTLDADVVGLIEIENDLDPVVDDEATAALVAALNDAIGAEVYDFVATGQIGTDAIKQAFIYKPETVSPTGEFAVLSDDAFVAPFTPGDPQNRPALAQTFTENASGEVFTAVVNHFKSKGSGTEAVVDGEPDDNPVEGSAALTRVAAAQALAAWLETDPTGSDDEDFLILGDLNAYASERAIQALEAEGYTNLVAASAGLDSTSFTFNGRLGSLDYAFANDSMTTQVTGSDAWRINSVEPSVLEYDSSQFDVFGDPDSPFGSSDHDPIIVGLDLGGAETQQIVVSATGESYRGAATFSVTVNGEVIASNVEAADTAADYVFDIDASVEIETVGVAFTNDLYGGTPDLDRNLTVSSVEFGGDAFTPLQDGTYTRLRGGEEDQQLHVESNGTMLWNGTLEFAERQVITVFASGENYLGDPRFDLLVNGEVIAEQVSVGSAAEDLSLSELADRAEAFVFKVDNDVAIDTIGVAFRNDRFGGSADADRNLFIDRIDVDGAAFEPGFGAAFTPTKEAASDIVMSAEQDGLLQVNGVLEFETGFVVI